MMSTVWIAVLALAAAAPPQETAVAAKELRAEPSPPVVARGESSKRAVSVDQVGSPNVKLRKRTGRELLTAVHRTRFDVCFDRLLSVEILTASGQPIASLD